jgi:GH25 family lysozyme M1 (1,4-beta-N-acetylmuramidase)
MSTLPVIGQAVTTSTVNVRTDSPSTQAPLAQTLGAGTTLNVQALVTGDSVQGNAQWFLINDTAYVWSGGCSAFVPSAPAVTTVVSSAVPNVVDISHGTAVTSFAQARAAGVIGIIHKATTGGTGTDPAYAARRSDALAAGLLWGAYHWGSAAPIDQQLDNFLNTAKPDAGTLVALDFEQSPGNQMTLDGARAFLQGIQDRLGRRAVLYSGSLIKSALGNTKDAFFGAHRLWLPQYGNQPTVQASWSTFWLWQYTDGTAGPGPCSVAGIPGDAAGHLDCDRFMGSEADLRQQWAS